MAEGPAEDLDALVKRVDPDRWLSSRFIADPDKRADVIALYAFDYELRRAVEGTSTAIMAEIRLTWWSEALDEIYAGGPVRKHPTAEALARAIRAGALPREPLDAAVEARFCSADASGPVAEAAALRLDPLVERIAVRAAVTADRSAARQISAAAFPAVAHVAIRGGGGSELRRRLRLTWAVLTGRL